MSGMAAHAMHNRASRHVQPKRRDQCPCPTGDALRPGGAVLDVFLEIPEAGYACRGMQAGRARMRGARAQSDQSKRGGDSCSGRPCTPGGVNFTSWAWPEASTPFSPFCRCVARVDHLRSGWLRAARRPSFTRKQAHPNALARPGARAKIWCWLRLTRSAALPVRTRFGRASPSECIAHDRSRCSRAASLADSYAACLMETASLHEALAVARHVARGGAGWRSEPARFCNQP